MSSSRRKPRPATGPSRRPRVAGLRKPGATPDPREHEAPEPEDVQDAAPEAPADDRPRPSPRPRPAEPEPPAADSDTDTYSDTYVDTDPETAAEPTAPSPDEQVDALTGEPEPPRPSPRRKERDEGVPKPESADEVAIDERPAEEPGKRERSPSSLYRLAAVLGVVALLLAALAVFFRVKGNELTTATDNTALLDVARTAQVKQEVGAAVEKLFSYDFNNVAKTEQAAKDLLVNDEVCGQYQRQFAEVKRLAPEQKMVVTTKVTRSAVVILDGDRAKVLVFVDQTSTRTDQNKTSAGGSQLSVNAELRDGAWKITGLNTYTNPAEPAPGEQVPSCA